MRFAAVCAALAAFAFQVQPAQAVTIDLRLTGILSGSQDVYNCGPFETNCASLDNPYSMPFTLDLSFPSTEFDDGFAEFDFGFFREAGNWKGEIYSLGGDQFLGNALAYYRESSGIHVCSAERCVGTIERLSAAAFDVSRINGVPEPATWVMMLLGFGAIGYGMRRVRTAPSSDQQTSSWSPSPASRARGAYQPWPA